MFDKSKVYVNVGYLISLRFAKISNIYGPLWAISISITLYKKWGFPLRISSVNVTKSAVSCDLVTFTEKILNRKLYFFVLCNFNMMKGLVTFDSSWTITTYSACAQELNITTTIFRKRWKREQKRDKQKSIFL